MEKAETAQKLIATYEANINFIEKRIAIQNAPGYTNAIMGVSNGRVFQYFEMMYSPFDIQLMQNKIDTIKNLLTVKN